MRVRYGLCWWSAEKIVLSLPKDIDIELSLMDSGDHQPQVKDAWLEYVIFN